MTWVPTGQASSPVAGPPRTPASNHLWVACGVALVCGLILYSVGAPLSRSIGLGLVVALAGFVLLRSLDAVSVPWPARPAGLSDRTARIQRWRLNGFDAMSDPHPGLSPHLQLRLQSLASTLLDRRRLVPGSPAAVALLGGATHDLLFSPVRSGDSGRPAEPTAGQLADMVDRLIALSAQRVPPLPLPAPPDASGTAVQLTKGPQ